MAKRDRTTTLPVILIISWLIPLMTCAADLAEGGSWARFRGPDGSGISGFTGLPARWTEADVRWKTRLPGRGHSSPVVWGDRVFVTSGNATNADRYIICLATGNGSSIWQKTFPSRRFPQNRENSFGSSTPAIDNQGIYVCWTTPEALTVAAISLDGQERWIKDLGPFKANHGSGASPIIYQGLVWINNDQDGPSSLIALEASSGEIKHRIERRNDKAAYATPCLFRTPGLPDQLIFASSSHGLTSVNPLEGSVNWDCTNLFKARIVGSPIASDGLIICSSGDGGVGRRLVALRPPNGTEAPTIVYELKTGIPYVPTPLSKDGRLYLLCDNGLLRCVRTATGEPIWEERLPERFYSSIVCAADQLYLTSKKGDVFVIKAADEYILLGRNSLGESSFATPAIANKTLFFRSETSVIAVAPRSHP